MSLSGLSIYLLKDFEGNIDNVIRKPTGDKLKGKVFSFDNNHWFIGKSDGGKPKWVEFFEESLPKLQTNSEFNNFKVRSSYGLYILKTKVKDSSDNDIYRYFAIPLGHGVHLLNMEYIEPSFGLKVVVNAVPYNDLRQVDLTVPEQNSQKKKFQSSINVDKEAFDINTQKDLLRGISGTLPKNIYGNELESLSEEEKEEIAVYELLGDIQESRPLGKSLSGRDNLRIGCSISSLTEIEHLCQRFYKYFQSNRYQKHFKWIDNFKAIGSNEPILKTLDHKLVKAIANKQTDNMSVAPPEYIDETTDYDGYCFTGNGKLIKNKEYTMFPAIGDFIDDYGTSKLGEFIQEEDGTLQGVQLLKGSCRLVLVNTDDKNKNIPWPLYKTISWETEENGEKYIISEGAWYKIDNTFKKDVEDFFNYHKKDKSDLMLNAKSYHNLGGGTHKKYEAGYNKYIGDNSNNKAIVFDLGVDANKKIKVGSAGNEFCDIFDLERKHMVHVKIGKSSAALSHLFRQGAFSAEMLKAESDFRQQVLEKSDSQEFKNLFPNNQIAPENFTVCFAIVLKNNQKKDIPFFSKVSMKDAIKEITRDGYKKTEFWFIETENTESSS